MRTLAGLVALALSIAARGTGVRAQGVPAQPPPSAADWPSYNRTLRGDRFAPQTAITPTTAPRLHAVCTYDLGSQAMMQSGPIVVGNVLYLTTAFDLIALDATTCAERWRTTETYTPVGMLVVNRGAAFADGRLFRGTKDGRVLAYDATTGRRVWGVQIADTRRMRTTGRSRGGAGSPRRSSGGDADGGRRGVRGRHRGAPVRVRRADRRRGLERRRGRARGRRHRQLRRRRGRAVGRGRHRG